MKFKTQNRFIYSLLILLLTVAILLPQPVLAEQSAIDEVRSLLQNDYVDPVSEDILNQPSIDKILEQLGDPYTSFMTAEEYANFSNSIEMKFSGIGVYVEMVSEGVYINGVIPNSPAEEHGLRAGDIIVKAGTYSLAGMSAEEAVSHIKGPEGTEIDLVILRDGSTFTETIERRTIESPALTSEMEPDAIGYLDLNTFGSDTGQKFGQALQGLRQQGALSYILDLRDNGGGYVTTAQSIAGYFIGNKTAMQVRYRDNIPETVAAYPQTYTIDKPVVVIINENSASASEILSGAIKDYNKAVFIGHTSFGKGCMQSLIPLDSGDYLKMTVARFYSPFGHEIHKVGITPDLPIKNNDPLLAAQLLLSASTEQEDKTGLVKLHLGSQDMAIDTSKATDPKYWPVFKEILDNVTSSQVKTGNGDNWQTVSAQDLIDRWSLYYPGYQLVDSLTDVPVDKHFTIHFSHAINHSSISNDTVQLVNSATGETIPLSFAYTDAATLTAIPTKAMTPGQNYWLVVHPTETDSNNHNLNSGFIAPVTVKSAS